MTNFIHKFRKILFLIADVFLICLAIYFAFLLRFEGIIPSQYFSNIWGIIILALVISLPIFNFLKLYSFSWSYVSTEELIALFKAVTLSFLFLAASLFILRERPIFVGFPRSTLFVGYFLVFLFCGSIRFSKRIYLRLFPKRSTVKKERTLIVGAGNAGEQILRSISTSSAFTAYLPIGFIDDDPRKQGVSIHGLKVLGKISDIPSVVRAQNVKEGTMIIALPSAGSETIRAAVGNGRKAGLKKIKIVPSLSEVINGQVGIGALREVKMDDLLGREPISLDQQSIENFIKNKKVLITGAAGSIGSELCRQVAKFSPSLLLVLDQDETGIFNISQELENKFPRLNISSLIADIQDRPKIEKIFNKFHPQVVFHAAAYKHVPLMEMHSDEAVKNNVFGMKTIAEMALECGAEKVVFISTDKAINPTSIMGATKRIGEMICQALNQKNSTKFISVRFGNVLNSRGSVIPIFKEQIKKREPIRVTHSEMKRYFMTTPEACLLVMQAGVIGQGGEVFVLDMGDPLKIVDLAKGLIRLSGLEPDKDIPIVFTEPRPGEKFFEEILTAEEGTKATQNQKIFMAKLSRVEEEKLNSGLEKLKTAAQSGDKELIINILKMLIPSYNHQ